MIGKAEIQSGYDSLAHQAALDQFDHGLLSKSTASLLELLEQTTEGTPEQIFLLSDLGNIYLYKSEYAIARDLFAVAIKQAGSLIIEQNPRYVDLLFRNSSAEAHLQNNLAAIIGFDDVRGIYNNIYGFDDPKTVGIILDIAELYLRIGNPSKASSFFDEAESMILSNPENISNEIKALLGRSRYYFDTHSYQESLHLLSKAMKKIRAESGEKDPQYITVLPFVSTCLANTGLSDSARSLLEFSLIELKEIMGEHHSSFLETKKIYANILWEMKNYDGALQNYLEIFDEYTRQFALFFHSMSTQERAVRYNRIGEIHEILASLIELNPKQELRHTFLQKTIVFGNLPMHPRHLLDYSSEPLFIEWKDNLEKLWKTYQLPVSSLDKGMSEIEKMEKQLAKQSQTIIKKGVVKKSQLLYSYPDVAEIQDKMDSTQVAIEIVRYRQYDPSSHNQFTDSIRYAYFVYSGKKENPVQYGVNKNGHELENRYLTYYRSSIKHRFIDDYAYLKYWSPLKDYVKGYENLIITPDGAYLQINLNTLRNPETHEYLRKEKNIRLVTSSANLLTVQNMNSDKQRRVSIFGNPNYEKTIKSINADNESKFLLYTSKASETGMLYIRDKIFEHNQWSELLYKDELKMQETGLLQSLYASSGFETDIFLADSASEKVIKSLESPFTIHISLRGYFMENQEFNPSVYQDNRLLQSGILFSGSSTYLDGKSEPRTLNDGILTTYEIFNLNLENTELVYLSSCETGLGIVPNDKAIKSFERAFQFAGASSIIMSMWTTESEYEIEFMNLFYYYWLFENKSKREAFTQAQDNMKVSYERPYYWGSFILLGE